jgi:hypothetical protein
VLFAGQLSEKPGSGDPPVPLHGFDRNPDDLRGFLDAQPAEEAQLHYPTLSRVDARESIERLIECEHFNAARLRDDQHFVEAHVQRISPTLRHASPACMVHQDAPHDLSAQRQEMEPAVAADSAGPFELEIRLVGEGGGFDALARAPMSELLARDTTQLRIDNGHQAVERVPIAGGPRREQSRHLMPGIGHGPKS